MLASSEKILSIAVDTVERTNILEARGIETVCRIQGIDRFGVERVVDRKWNRTNTTDFIGIDFFQ